MVLIRSWDAAASAASASAASADPLAPGEREKKNRGESSSIVAAALG